MLTTRALCWVMMLTEMQVVAWHWVKAWGLVPGDGMWCTAGCGCGHGVGLSSFKITVGGIDVVVVMLRNEKTCSSNTTCHEVNTRHVVGL
jgi:uncharacterized membrane protein YhiD involved in acid resistance